MYVCFNNEITGAAVCIILRKYIMEQIQYIFNTALNVALYLRIYINIYKLFINLIKQSLITLWPPHST